jgi:ubiquinone/menaquinone biosynthesis C-methylase UbiE
MTIKGLILLDAGCGDGRITNELAIQGAHTIVAIDLATQVLENAKKRLDEHRSTTHLIQCDIEKLPFNPSAFEAITCLDTLVHIPNPRNAVSEFYYVMKQGGNLAINITNNNPFWRIRGKTKRSLSKFFEEVFLYNFPENIVNPTLKLLNKRMIGKHISEKEFKSIIEEKLRIEYFLEYGQKPPVYFMAIARKHDSEGGEK